MRRVVRRMVALAGIALANVAFAAEPVLIGLDAELDYANSTSAEAIRAGIRIAMDEVNAAGGVLGGRPLALVERANHSVPARSIQNVEEMAAMKDLVAVFCGRFGPPVIEALPTIHAEGLPLLDPWSAPDAIVDNGYRPNFAFRLSIRDGWAMAGLLRRASTRGFGRVGLLLLNTTWGRGSLSAAEAEVARAGRPSIVGTRWVNSNDSSFLRSYEELRRAGAEAIVLVANTNEAAGLVREVAALPAEQRVPILSHWGITGGNLPELTGAALARVDLEVIQTFSFIDARRARAARVIAAHDARFGSHGARTIKSPAGVAHAYDLTHLLARAIERAGSTERRKVRSALERLDPYDGLIRRYARPFTPERHEALTAADTFMARYADDGALVRVTSHPRGPIHAR